VRRAVRIVAWIAAVPVAAAIALAVAVLGWRYPVEELSVERGGPLIVVDRDGTVLREVPSADGRPGRAGWVSLDSLPPAAVAAIVASEDERFYQHHGVDPRGVVRALWLNVAGGRVAYGGSTITMQLVRMVHHAGAPRTLGHKIEEAVLALRLERELGKREILEQYLNRAYYANGAYGLDSAARTYFGKPAVSLSVGQATLLAVVPRGPNRYDPLRHLDEAVRRRDYVLGQLVQKGYLSAETAALAFEETVTPTLHPAPFRAPHFVDWVLVSLPADVRAHGGVVKTTLDLPLQERLEAVLAEHVEAHGKRGLGQAGMVVLDTKSGDVRAMVGSKEFFAAEGQVNITTWRRHPGSALKPFVYALALAEGDTPASIALDIGDVESEYKIARLTQPEHGPVRYREALAGSYNLAAIHVLERVGVEKLLTTLRTAGVALEGAPRDYGLRLALGSGRVRLLDLASAYGFLGRGGQTIPARGVVELARDDGAIWAPPLRREVRLFTPEVSWLVYDMLADDEARHAVFGQELPFELPGGVRVAAKTGTSRGFSDTVAVAVTRELTVAAWAGNFDGAPTQGLIAMQSAAPLVRAGLLAASGGRELTHPKKPETIVDADVCALSGLEPGASCPHRRREHFAPGTVPTRTCDWHQDHAGELAVQWPEAAREWARQQRVVAR
jgi:penicillin-binding protein 1C